MFALVDNSLTQAFEADITSLLSEYSESDGSARRSLEQLRLSDPAAFARASVHVLTSLDDSPGSRYLLSLLSQSSILIAPLADPDACTREQALTVAQAAARISSSFVQRLEDHLRRLLDAPQGGETSARLIRVLELLDRIGAKACWSALRLDLLEYPEDRVRAKAAMLIVRHTKNTTLASKLMLNPDPRIQASAVEGMWDLDPSGSGPFFHTAAQSKHPRVAANAALGLYRTSDPASIGLLTRMLAHPDQAMGVSGAWAIAETRDPRFIPALEARYKTAPNSLRFGIAKALATIRRQQRLLDEKPFELRVVESAVSIVGVRTVLFSVRPVPGFDPSTVRPTAISIHESGEPVEKYEVKLPRNIRKLLVSLIGPRIANAGDERQKAVAEALQRSAGLLRHDDACRFDRYATDHVETESATCPGASPFPYQESFMTAAVKTHRGFLNDSAVFAEIASSPGPRECSAPDALAAVARAVDAMAALGGERHVFLLLASECEPPAWSADKAHALQEKVRQFGVAIHCLAESTATPAEYRALCLGSPGGSFTVLAPSQWASAVEDAHLGVLGHFEVTYSGSADAEGEIHGKIALACQSGAGSAEFRLERR